MWSQSQQGYFRLYNLADDPTEQHNLAQQHPERVQQMQAAIAAHVCGSLAMTLLGCATANFFTRG
jgi:hypothetical protein